MSRELLFIVRGSHKDEELPDYVTKLKIKHGMNLDSNVVSWINRQNSIKKLTIRGQMNSKVLKFQIENLIELKIYTYTSNVFTNVFFPRIERLFVMRYFDFEECNFWLNFVKTHKKTLKAVKLCLPGNIILSNEEMEMFDQLDHLELSSSKGQDVSKLHNLESLKLDYSEGDTHVIKLIQTSKNLTRIVIPLTTYFNYLDELLDALKSNFFLTEIKTRLRLEFQDLEEIAQRNRKLQRKNMEKSFFILSLLTACICIALIMIS